jgi:hypothetical protein
MRLILSVWLCTMAVVAYGSPCGQPLLMGFVDDDGNAFVELPAALASCESRGTLLAANRAFATVGQPMYATELPPPTKGAPSAKAADTRAALPAALAACQSALTNVADGTGQARPLRTERLALIARDASVEGKGELKGACWYATHAPSKNGQPVPASEVKAEEAQWLIAQPGKPAPKVRPLVDNWQQFDMAPERLPADAPLRDWLNSRAVRERLGAAYWAGIHTVYAQRFDLRLQAGQPAQPVALIGTISNAGGAYVTWTAIVRLSGSAPQVLFESGVQAKGGYVAQAVAGVVLDGADAPSANSVESLVLRARYYEGGNYRIIGWQGGAMRDVFQSQYLGN